MLPLLKWVLSFWIIFHLSVLLVMQNGSSSFAQNMGAFYRYYSNQLGLNTNWNFFSPDPAQIMYLRYKVYFLNDAGDEIKESLEGFLPPGKEKGNFGLAQRRYFYLTRFLLLSEDRIEKYLVPWICRQNEGATKIFIQTRVEITPDLNSAAEKNRSAEHQTQKINFFQKEFGCPEANNVSSSPKETL